VDHFREISGNTVIWGIPPRRTVQFSRGGGSRSTVADVEAHAYIYRTGPVPARRHHCLEPSVHRGRGAIVNVEATFHSGASSAIFAEGG
jgi:hypothetical protein